MPWARAAPLFAQICGALQEAHELGIVHRDLKPENVLITRTTGGRDFAKVLDFGLAKLDGAATPNDDRSSTAIVGTPYFMSPEQIRGDEVDARTDIYSFGALMFEVLTGEHLYPSSTAVGVLTKHLTAEPDAPSMRAPKMGIPSAVDHIVPQGARARSGRALAVRGRARRGDRGGLRRDGHRGDRAAIVGVARARAAGRLDAERSRTRATCGYVAPTSTQYERGLAPAPRARDRRDDAGARGRRGRRGVVRHRARPRRRPRSTSRTTSRRRRR